MVDYNDHRLLSQAQNISLAFLPNYVLSTKLQFKYFHSQMVLLFLLALGFFQLFVLKK